jgi:hypothetical protein
VVIGMYAALLVGVSTLSGLCYRHPVPTDPRDIDAALRKWLVQEAVAESAMKRAHAVKAM